MVGGGRAYYSAADYYTLRLFWHRAEASGVHSQCSVHAALPAGSAELLAQFAAGLIARVEGSAKPFQTTQSPLLRSYRRHGSAF